MSVDKIALFALIGFAIIAWMYAIYISFTKRSKQAYEAFTNSCDGKQTKEDRDRDKDPGNLFGPNIYAHNDDIAYSNPLSANAWTHHEMRDSLEIDPKMQKAQYKNAYYYEHDNLSYENGLRKALTVPCALVFNAVKTSNWSDSYNSSQPGQQEQHDEVYEAYQKCILYIYAKINTSGTLDLPGATSSPPTIQVVHDILKSYSVHLTEKSMYMIDMELLLYRENKYHGKRVHFVCTAKKSRNSWQVNVVSLEILGVIPEDQIALFPVVPQNPFDVQQMPVNEDVDVTNTSPMECATVKNTIQCTPSSSTLTSLTSHNTTYTQLAQSELKLLT
jgi:hypothetical protein